MKKQLNFLEKYKLGQEFTFLGKLVRVTSVRIVEMPHYAGKLYPVFCVEVGWWSGDVLQTKQLNRRDLDLLVEREDESPTKGLDRNEDLTEKQAAKSVDSVELLEAMKMAWAEYTMGTESIDDMSTDFDYAFTEAWQMAKMNHQPTN